MAIDQEVVAAIAVPIGTELDNGKPGKSMVGAIADFNPNPQPGLLNHSPR